jgi:Dyp-type peroxidase family
MQPSSLHFEEPSMALPSLNQPLTWKAKSASVNNLLEDLQANILKGHGRNESIHLFLSFDPARKAGILAAIHQLSGHIKTARQQLIETEHFNATGKDGGTTRCFFLTFAGYVALGVEAKAPEAPVGSAFHDGMKTRADLKDEAVITWDAHFQQTVHAMLLLADADAGRLSAERDSVVAALQAVGVTLLGEERGHQQRNARGEGVEHFGYVDGRSQPLLLTEDIDHEEQSTDGTSMWNPAFPLDQVLVTTGTGAAQVVQGSFFVFRKLEQNVLRFKRKEEELADSLLLLGDARELAGAMMVGRFEDGTPVVLRNEAGVGGGVPNNFNYDDDKAGIKCPFHAHIRKTNPRGSGGFEGPPGERRHLMARRGITYGEREDGMGDRPEDRVGLLFMAYQASLENQFEFTQKNWANTPVFPRVPALPPGLPQPGIDPVIGQGTNPPDTQHCPLHWGVTGTATQASDFGGFVKMKGGEYFFAPVLSTLRTL